MSFVPLEAQEDQALPPEQVAPPRSVAPAFVPVEAQESAPAPAPEPTTEYTPVEAQAAEPAPGPFENAVRGAGEALGGAVAPAMAQAPEPVQNLANIVGQPAGGLVDTVTNVSGALGQGNIPDAVMAGLAPAMAPGEKVTEQVGERVARGDTAVVDPAQAAPAKGILSPVLDPLGQTAVGQAIGGILGADLPFADQLPPPPTAFGSAAAGAHPEEALSAGGLIPEWLGIDAWAQQNPDVVQTAYDQGGGQAVVDAFVNSVSGVNSVPPPQLSNPLDAGTSGNPVERALQIAGAVPEFAGGWLESGKQGTLGPFLKGTALYGAMDPLVFLPPAWGEAAAGRLAGAAGRGVRRIPVVSKALELAPDEVARQAQEQSSTAAGEYLGARRQQMADPLGADVPVPPPTAAVPPPDAPFVSAYAGRPWQERPVAYTPDGPIFRDELMRSAAPPRNVPAPDPPPPPTPRGAPPPYQGRYPGSMIEEFFGPNGAKQYRFVDTTTRQQVPNSPTFTTYREARDFDKAARKTPTTPPSADAIGLGGSRWIDGRGQTIVEHPGSPRARIRPRERARVESVYHEMFDAPPEQFYAPYPARYTDRNVPVGDAGRLSRYRGAMTQGLFMLDDWPAAHVARVLPDAMDATGRVDWPVVERIAASGNEQARTAARKALAGKRAHDLYSHRISRAADPDTEVRHLLLSYHLDQVSGRFDAPQYTNTTYWADRAAAIGEAVMDAGYMPTQRGLDRLRLMNLVEEARTAFPGIPEARLASLRDVSLLDDIGQSLVARTPDGQTIPVVPVSGQGLTTPGAGTAAIPTPEAEAIPVVTPEQAAPTPPTPPLPDLLVAPEEAAARQAVRAAYAAAPEDLQREVAASGADALSRYGVATSDQAARDLAREAQGRFRFRDGWEPRGALTDEDVINQLAFDVELWADPARTSTWEGAGRGGAAEGRMTRTWQQLDQRFNPDGDLDPADFAGAGRESVRDALALRIYDEAQTRSRPSGAPPTKLGRINEQYLTTLRRLQLFNVGNVPRYTLQNLLGNSVNITARGGGARVALGMFTKPSRWVQVFRNQKSGYTTFYGTLEATMGLGHKPNIPMLHKPYIQRGWHTSKPPKGLEIITKVFTPDFGVAFANIPDQLGREHVASSAILRGHRALNRELPGMVMQELRSRRIGIPDAKVRQVVGDFLTLHRTKIDPNTGKPYRTITGRAARYEPVFDAHDFAAYLREHLAEDMVRRPDTTALKNAVDRVFRTTRTEQRKILDGAEAQVDHALFSWRDTNADVLLSRVTLFHYWMSRQGGFYVSEGLKRPAVFAAYGRMMDEMEQQAAELDQPNWLRGFFQMQNSIAGFSMWHSPFDAFTSLLTFAEWQYGEDAADAVYKDLTALGKGASQIPYFIHPLVQYVGYATGALGPDYYAPSLTGLETFGAKAIDFLNYANAHDQLPAWVNAAGIGVDENGNKIPVPVRPLQELYARFGNAVSTALEPITGLTPVEVSNMAGSQERNIASIGEQRTRLEHPEWEQMRVNRHVTDALADPGSDDYQAWFREASEMPYLGDARLPGPLQAAQRLVSPVRTYVWPEQYNVDRWEGLQPSGALPPRNLPEDPAHAKDVFNEAKYGATTTVEGRRLSEMNTEFNQLTPAALKEARGIASNTALLSRTEPVTIGGVEYTPEDLQAIYANRKQDLYELGTQYLADAGYTREDAQASYDAEARYKADHPDYAQYKEYQSLVGAHPGGQQGFVMETAATNPGFAQFVRSSMLNHATGEIDYDRAFNPDAYLASQGVRPSVYSPLVGNEPSTTPGGYPSLAGVQQGQPLSPQVTTTGEIPIMGESGGWDNPVVATLPAGFPLQVIDATVGDGGMVQVSAGTPQGGQPIIGYVDAALLQSAAPAPASAPAAANPVQPQGGLAGLAGNVVGALGGAKDAIGSLFGPGTASTASPEANAYAGGVVDPRTITSDMSGQQLVGLAQQFVGVPYEHNFPTAQTDPWTTGWDCSSFIHWLADNAGTSEVQYPNGPGYVGGGLPVGAHFQWQWAEANDMVTGSSWQDAQPGDAIYFNTDPARERCDPANWNGCMNNDASHVGLYLGLDPATGRPRMLHAAAPGIGTVVDYLDSYPYPALGVVRFLPS